MKRLLQRAACENHALLFFLLEGIKIANLKLSARMSRLFRSFCCCCCSDHRCAAEHAAVESSCTARRYRCCSDHRCAAEHWARGPDLAIWGRAKRPCPLPVQVWPVEGYDNLCSLVVLRVIRQNFYVQCLERLSMLHGNKVASRVPTMPDIYPCMQAFVQNTEVILFQKIFYVNIDSPVDFKGFLVILSIDNCEGPLSIIQTFHQSLSKAENRAVTVLTTLHGCTAQRSFPSTSTSYILFLAPERALPRLR